MKIAYFPNQCARNSDPVISAMLTSLKQAGHECIENSMDADVAIIWSVLWHGRMIQNQKVWENYKKNGCPVIVVDIGALRRGQTWKIALNSLTANGYYGHFENLDWDRPKKLGINLSTNLSRDPKIVIAAQHAQSLQVAGLGSIENWISTQIEKLRTVTDRPLVVRPHPRSPLKIEELIALPKNVIIEQPIKLVSTYDSYDLTFNYHALVNYNSGPGIQAAIAGTRPIVDITSLAYPVSIKLEDIDKPYTVDRDQWLVEICHTEYTVEEIEKGLWIQRLDLSN